jgi:cleavage and polyadenylation specificity factor subunit 1
MQIFGKTVGKIDVVAAEFLPYGKSLYFVVADSEANIHLLQFDPERE